LSGRLFVTLENELGGFNPPILMQPLRIFCSSLLYGGDSLLQLRILREQRQSAGKEYGTCYQAAFAHGCKPMGC
jgi:hypothetical protein